jgi:hypothetical protein
MDANKLAVLGGVQYQIARTCGTCKHSTFPNNNWGTCGLLTYQHLKHTGAPRQLSIYRYGCCVLHEMNVASQAELGLFEQFLK